MNMMRSAGYEYIAASANEEDGVEDLNLAVDLEVGKDNAPVVAAQVVPAATTTTSVSTEEDELTWSDDFFADRTDVVAAFDFNQDEYARSRNARTYWILSIGYSSFLVLFLVFVVPYTSFLIVTTMISALYFVALVVAVGNQLKPVWIPHLAITTTGVRYVEPPEKECRFLGSTVHIPFENIEAIEITRNGAASVVIRTSSPLDWSDYVVRGCAPRGLPKNRRSTMVAEGRDDIVEDDRDCDGTRFEIWYLVEPYRFKKLVMSLKQQQQVAKLDKREEDVALSSGGVEALIFHG